MARFSKRFPQNILFTASWSSFALGYENTFRVKVVGTQKVFRRPSRHTDYNALFIYLSPTIVVHLLKFKPQVVFSVGFCLWTALALLIKSWGGWRVVIIYDGSTPNVDRRSSPLHLWLRRLMTRFADGLITNTAAGKSYLVEVLKAQSDRVYARPYLVPDVQALQQAQEVAFHLPRQEGPIFLFIGKIIPRKGLRQLLEACSILQHQGQTHYRLMILGEGWQRSELETLSKTYGLDTQVQWRGAVAYSQLGAYLQQADVLVFPTLEDVWGMVIPEAMALGKPVLCSQWAGAAELVVEGENGYCFDPNRPQRLAELMEHFIANPDLGRGLGQKSQQFMASHTPAIAVGFLQDVALTVWQG